MPSTPHNEPKEVERLKAFELYLSASLEGKPRSLRSIAGSLGLNPSTVRRWAEVDGWDQKIHKTLSESAVTAEATQNAIKRQVRRGLLDGLTELRRLSLQATREKERIDAVKALVDIAIRIDAVTAAASAGKGEDNEVEFSDDLPEDNPEWPLATSETETPPTDPPSLSESGESESSSLAPEP